MSAATTSPDPLSRLLQALEQRGYRDLDGTRLEAIIPIHQDLLNLALAEVDVPSLRSLTIVSLEEDIVSLRIETSVPLLKEKTIRLRPMPSSDGNPLLQRIEVVGGLNRIERWLLGELSSKGIQTQDGQIVIDLRRLLFEGKPVAPLADAIKLLKLRADGDRLELSLLFHKSESQTPSA